MVRSTEAFSPGGIAKCQLPAAWKSDLVESQAMTGNNSHSVPTSTKCAQSMLYLNCLLFNARSVVANLFEFQYALYSCNYDIILVTESWLTANDSNSLFDPEGEYVIVRLDRRCNVGGRVCVTIRRGLEYTELCYEDADGVEMLFVDVSCDLSLIRFINIYCPPQYGVEAREYVKKLVSHLKLLCQVAWSVFIVGNLNCPGIDWQSNSAPSDGVQDKLFECVEEFGFVQCVCSPSRGSKELDLVLSNEPLLLSSLSVMDPVGNSDHNSVRFCLMAKSKSQMLTLPTQSVHSTDKPALSLHYSWDQADYKGFLRYLSQINWQALISYNLTADAL